MHKLAREQLGVDRATPVFPQSVRLLVRETWTHKSSATTSCCSLTCKICMTAIPNSGLWGSLHIALPVNILGEIWRAITNLIHFPSPWHFLPKKGWDECGMLSVGLLQRLGATYDVLVSGFVANSKYKIQALFKDPNCIFQAPKLSTKAIS